MVLEETIRSITESLTKVNEIVTRATGGTDKKLARANAQITSNYEELSGLVTSINASILTLNSDLLTNVSSLNTTLTTQYNELDDKIDLETGILSDSISSMQGGSNNSISSIVADITDIDTQLTSINGSIGTINSTLTSLSQSVNASGGISMLLTTNSTSAQVLTTSGSAYTSDSDVYNITNGTAGRLEIDVICEDHNIQIVSHAVVKNNAVTLSGTTYDELATNDVHTVSIVFENRALKVTVTPGRSTAINWKAFIRYTSVEL